ncbi:MAG TPA: hypothetical protein PKN59_03185 [Syntrophales bacterium]|nr:hypothetical protein [Syntrophales bacterium]HNS53192.1 hypothetical protein [Syntrophales bacterium]
MPLEAIFGYIGPAILIAVPFLLVYALAFKEIRRRRDRRAALEAIGRELSELREKIAVFPTATVPGRKIAGDLGPVSAEGSAGAGFLGVAEKRALILLLKRALALGADAVVDIRHERATDSAGNVRWQSGVVKLAGRAVRLSEEGRPDPSL